MKFITFVFLLLSLSFSAAAKDLFDLDLNLQMNGEEIMTGKITTFEGREATIEKVDNGTKTKTLVNMTATNKEIQGRKGILVKIKVDHTKNKKREVREQEILVLENQLAEMEVGDTETGKQDIKLSVLVKKLKNNNQ